MAKLEVKNLAKAYKKYPNKLARIREWVTGNSAHENTWVLQGIDFEVGDGEAVGIIGMNGAGKSTLLKIITGTTHPTIGSVQVHGRVAALLELGMGFHGDFTGRQNVFMAGQILGLSIEEISSRMSEIEAFAEIGEYIDRPVRTYSSGMQMRLAFSVATAVRPDVLIVDEALSVGDSYFQHKSFEKIREFRKKGSTLLIVSHDKQAIQSICDRAILLDKGKIALQGSPETVMDYYNALIASHQDQKIKQEITPTGKVQTVSGTGEAEVKKISLVGEDGRSTDVFRTGEHVNLKVEVQVNSKIEKLVLGYGIKDRLGQVMYGTNTWHKKQIVSDLSAGDYVIYEFAFSMLLGVGSYSIQTALASSETHLQNNYEWRDLALVFNVVNTELEDFAGSVWMNPVLKINRNCSNDQALGILS